jgi:hypothetical protein
LPLGLAAALGLALAAMLVATEERADCWAGEKAAAEAMRERAITDFIVKLIVRCDTLDQNVSDIAVDERGSDFQERFLFGSVPPPSRRVRMMNPGIHGFFA